jgi:hypothetical protein
VLRENEDLQLRREPLFRHDLDRLFVPNRSGGNLRCRPCACGRDALDRLLTEVLLRRLSACFRNFAGRKPPPSNVAKLPLIPRPPPGGGRPRLDFSIPLPPWPPALRRAASSSREVTTTAPSESGSRRCPSQPAHRRAGQGVPRCDEQAVPVGRARRGVEDIRGPDDGSVMFTLTTSVPAAFSCSRRVRPRCHGKYGSCSSS